MKLHFVDATTDLHFAQMSLIHALGWRDTYADALPADYMAREITDDRWIPFFREDYQTGRCHGLLLYRENMPVGCINYGPARTENYNAGQSEGSQFHSEAYRGWGEIISFYVHPEARSLGYGGLLLEEACRRLKASGFANVYVLVLRENEGARRFYARHGFSWDGTHEEIPFPHDTVCIDLRYCRAL
jgi:ribosomal protein S18 acetylase RimI-like enzyme